MPNLNLQSGSYSVATWITGDGANPTPGETITIGTDIYEWDGVGVNINVAIGIDLAASIDALITAIEANTTEDINVWRETNTLFLMPVDDDDDYEIAGTLPALAASQAADPWQNYAGQAGGGRVAAGQIVIDAALAARVFTIQLPFTPTRAIFEWLTTAGVKKACTATHVAGVDRITVDPTAGGTPGADTDVLNYVAWE